MEITEQRIRKIIQEEHKKNLDALDNFLSSPEALKYAIAFYYYKPKSNTNLP